MTIEEYFGKWKTVIDLKEADRLLKRLSSSGQVICPQINNVFKAFRLCSLDNLSVVVIGQDPYCNLSDNKPVATGIAFANSPDTAEDCYSSSLKILSESVIDFTIPHRRVIFDPSLEKWEKQGVLMLNSALSCQANRTGSHSLMWRPFVKSLITSLSRHTTGIVYVLMGSDAQSFESCINKDFNYIIKSRHPSWYARKGIRMPSDIWREIDDITFKLNGFKINWYTEY